MHGTLRRGARLVIASHNEGKVREIAELFAPFGIETVPASSLGLAEPQETGKSFAENAALKALAAAKASGLPALADDSGLEVTALGGAPGPVTGGMNQLVGDTGWQLSHGERSRLFLARALLQGGELVLLDESFAALDPEGFRDCFVAWTASLARHIEGVVAIDGKTLRRSFDRANGQAAIHMVSAWSSSQHLVLGQEKVAEKSNEITAIPKLLDLLSLKGAIVTIDAIGCQTAIARKILDKGADYVLALKGNQGTLHQDIALFFEEQAGRGFADARFDHHATADADHGRIEERDCWVTGDIDWLRDAHADWPALRSIVMIRARRTLNGQTGEEPRYFISSLAPDARQLAAAVRAHWGIENNLHWVLDMTFREDESRIRKDNAPANASILKHMALNMLKKNPSRRSIRLKRKSAGWDDEFLQSVLSAA